MSNKSGISSQVVSVPKGGGAIPGIGEKFAPDIHTGTGNFSVPISIPAGRNGVQPQLALSYSTGNGNSPFGMGWALSAPMVSRKTAKGVPIYDDGVDVFVLSGAEDLVPVGSESSKTIRYRPRTEGSFERILHHVTDTDDYWEVWTRSGQVNIYGTPGRRGSDPATVTHPGTHRQIYAWFLSLSKDPFGNRIEYQYIRDAVQVDGPHEWDQLYLSKIRYIDYGPNPNDYLASVEFEYAHRPDPFSECRAGFEIRTVKRCQQIRTFTHAASDRLVRSYKFSYLDELGLPAALLPPNGVSLLGKIDVSGHDGADVEALPPLTFSYALFEPKNRRFSIMTGEDLPPGSLARPEYELADLNGDGLPDIIEMSATVRYWRNLGDGRFALPREMPTAPAGVRLDDPGVQLVDADGDGRIDLLVVNDGVAGYYPLRFDGTWDSRSFQRYPMSPSFDVADPEVRFVDLDGDGVVDAIRAGASFECYFNHPKKGWHRTRRIERRALAEFPNINFSDPRVRFADLNGDGLQDIVLVHSGRIDYWPALGHGNWGRRVTMHNCPQFPFDYDPRRILIGDVDGDGLADLVYVDDAKVILWMNQAGNGWSPPITIHGTPPISDLDAVRLADMLGTGVAGILWSRDADNSSPSNLYFLDFTGGTKPYLLDQMDNHMGALTRVRYSPSTRFYIEDARQARRPWRTSLPFPVHVVAGVTTTDVFSASTLITEYSYHHGHWDGAEREFRGFARVDQRDADSAIRGGITIYRSPPTETRSWFHLGPIGPESGDWLELDLSDEYWSGDPTVFSRAPEDTELLRRMPRRAQRDAIRALRGRLLRSELYALDGSELKDRPYTVTEQLYGVSALPLGAAWPLAPEPWQERVFFSFARVQRATQWERGSEPMSQLSFTGDYDQYGLARYSMTVAVPRGRDYRAAAPPGAPYLATLSFQNYAQRDDNGRYIVDRLCRAMSFEILNDGSMPAFRLHSDTVEGRSKKRLVGLSINYFDGAPFIGLPFGRLGDFGALVRTEQLAFSRELMQELYKSSNTILSPPEEPPYLVPTGTPPWTSEYPAEFRNLLATLGGYTYQDGRSQPEYTAGYYITVERRRYDFQDRRLASRGRVTALKDPLGNQTDIEYDTYDLLVNKLTDPLALSLRAEHDYRTLQVRRIVDPNGNQTLCTYTPLGLVASTAVMGRVGEKVGDTENSPGTAFVHDLLAYTNRKQPVSVRTVQRLYHANDTSVALPERDDTIERIEYSDGHGRILQTRALAEDLTFGDPIFSDSGLPADQSARVGDAVGQPRPSGAPPRVSVTGWQLYDNKGQVVERYEPFFSNGWDYAAPLDAERGEKAALFYDPRGRLLRTVNPDSSEQLLVYGVPGDLTRPDRFAPTPWEVYTYDTNDNAGRTHPATSKRYQNHWDTPSNIIVDALGRTVERIQRNGADPSKDWYHTRTQYDIQGNVLTLTDALGRIAFQYSYDLLNRAWRTIELDAGLKRTVPDAAGKPIEQRDSKGALILTGYDLGNRPIRMWARDRAGQPHTLRQRIIYGDSKDSMLSTTDAQKRNVLGKPYRHYDEAGLVLVEKYDFKGNLLEKGRQVIADSELLLPFKGPPPGWKIDAYQVDWQTLVSAKLDPTVYSISITYDALNRVRSLLHPIDQDGERKELRPRYNRAGALESISLGGKLYVQHIAYNARGQRILIAYGNRIMMRQVYDKKTMRLLRMRAESYAQPSSMIFRPTGTVLQDLVYEYDLGGNILAIHDRAPNSGLPISPDRLDRAFSYDPIYRLLSATGRESDLSAPAAPWDSSPKGHDPTKTRAYLEQYEYDPNSNITILRHHSSHDSFTRSFAYARDTNKLNTVIDRGKSYSYLYDDAANLTNETSSRHFEWNHSSAMRVFRIQTAGAEPSIYCIYLYDASGRKIKKLTRKIGGETETSIYIEDVFERQKRSRGITIQQNDSIVKNYSQSACFTLRIGVPFTGDRTPSTKYYISDHLGSANITADETGTWLDREEYTPYGDTSFGSFSLKRYRFIGKDRDDYSGLLHCGLRFLASWLCRWINPDPIGQTGGINPYVYSACNPIGLIDSSGTSPTESSSTAGSNQGYQTLDCGNQTVNFNYSVDTGRAEAAQPFSDTNQACHPLEQTANQQQEADNLTLGGESALGLRTFIHTIPTPLSTHGQIPTGSLHLFTGPAAEAEAKSAIQESGWMLESIYGSPTREHAKALERFNLLTNNRTQWIPDAQYKSTFYKSCASDSGRAAFSRYAVVSHGVPSRVQLEAELPAVARWGSIGSFVGGAFSALSAYSAFSLMKAGDDSPLLPIAGISGILDYAANAFSAIGYSSLYEPMMAQGVYYSKAFGLVGAVAWAAYQIPKDLQNGDTTAAAMTGLQTLGVAMITFAPLAGPLAWLPTAMGITLIGAGLLFHLNRRIGLF